MWWVFLHANQFQPDKAIYKVPQSLMEFCLTGKISFFSKLHFHKQSCCTGLYVGTSGFNKDWRTEADNRLVNMLIKYNRQTLCLPLCLGHRWKHNLISRPEPDEAHKSSGQPGLTHPGQSLQTHPRDAPDSTHPSLVIIPQTWTCWGACVWMNLLCPPILKPGMVLSQCNNWK